MIEHGWSLTKAAEAAEVSERTCSKWVARYRAEGVAGCWIAPRRRGGRQPHRRARGEVIAALRRLRFTGPEIAELLDRPLSTVSGILTRIGMGSSAGSGWSPPSATSASGRAS